MLGGDTDARSTLNRLLLKSGHVLEWRTEFDSRGLDLSRYDMLLVDGTPREYEGMLQLRGCCVRLGTDPLRQPSYYSAR
jgi:hypothetical protein